MRRFAATLVSTVVTMSVAFAVNSGPAEARAGSIQSGDVVPGQLLVKFLPASTAQDITAAERVVGARFSRAIEAIGVRVLRVPESRTDQVLDALRHNASVEFAEPDFTARGVLAPNDPLWPSQWGPTQVNAATVWDKGTGAQRLVVALIDSGIKASHPDLVGRIVPGWDFVNGDADPTDDLGHGTSVTGVATATGNNASGIAGMCWKCSIMPVKVLNSSNWGSWSDVSSAITWAVDHGARVLNMSIVGASRSATLESAVRYATDKGAVVIAAAGNTGDTSVRYPAAIDGVLGVAASSSADQRYIWSTYGSWVDVAAPGCNLTTTMSGAYGWFCGTSSATPLVSGIAALLAVSRPDATNSQITAAITDSAVGVGSWVRYGRVDAAAALTRLGPPPPPSSPTTLEFTGTLTDRVSSRPFTFATGAGSLVASLTAQRGASLTLSLVDATGRTIIQRSGTTSLRLEATVTQGTWTLVVTGSRTAFTLTATVPIR
jgi:thermitase